MIGASLVTVHSDFKAHLTSMATEDSAAICHPIWFVLRRFKGYLIKRVECWPLQLHGLNPIAMV